MGRWWGFGGNLGLRPGLFGPVWARAQCERCTEPLFHCPRAAIPSLRHPVTCSIWGAIYLPSITGPKTRWVCGIVSGSPTGKWVCLTRRCCVRVNISKGNGSADRKDLTPSAPMQTRLVNLRGRFGCAADR